MYSHRMNIATKNGPVSAGPFFVLALFLERVDFFFGTFAPFLRAFERPMAMACFLLVTFFPERPLLRVPRLRSCIAFFTSFWDDLLYFAMSCSFRTFLKVKRTCGMPVIVTRSLRGIAHAVRKCENPAI